jgi:topoisomerase IA-like protein
MESENKVIGKINKKKCYLNHGKYGHYLTVDSKNYKVPEWLPPEKMDIDIAERLIEYKIKMSEQWLESKPIKKKLRVIAKVRKKHLNKPKQKNK